MPIVSPCASYAACWRGGERHPPTSYTHRLCFPGMKTLFLVILSCVACRHKRVESKYIEIYKLVYTDRSEISPYQSLLAKDLGENITVALNKIPPKCRRIFDLSRMEGLKYSEISVILDISVKTVEAHMSKALSILRYELREYLK